MKTIKIQLVAFLILLQICNYTFAKQSSGSDEYEPRNPTAKKDGTAKRNYGPHDPHGPHRHRDDYGRPKHHQRHGPPMKPVGVDELIDSITQLNSAALNTIQTSLRAMIGTLPDFSFLKQLFNGIIFLIENANILGPLKTGLNAVNFGVGSLSSALNPVNGLNAIGDAGLLASASAIKTAGHVIGGATKATKDYVHNPLTSAINAGTGLVGSGLDNVHKGVVGNTENVSKRIKDHVKTKNNNRNSKRRKRYESSSYESDEPRH